MRERWAIDRLNRSTGRVRDQALRANIITIARVRGQAWPERAGAVRAWKYETLSASRGRSSDYASHHHESGNSRWKVLTSLQHPIRKAPQERYHPSPIGAPMPSRIAPASPRRLNSPIKFLFLADSLVTQPAVQPTGVAFTIFSRSRRSITLWPRIDIN